MNNDPGKIRITAEELAHVTPARPSDASVQPGEPRSYGNITEASPAIQTDESAGSLLLRAWCYLGIAGFIGATLAWTICEPAFSDGGGGTWANVIIFPLMLVLMCIGFGVAESIVERSPQKAAIRGGLSLALGTVLGFILFGLANLIFTIGAAIVGRDVSASNPKFWLARGVAWMAFGIAGGVVYGIVGQSARRSLYGIVGGVVGAGIGGMIFDPISIATGGAAISRAIGMAIFGAATGVAMGLVENALKDRWLYVAAGPLAGKQFILYKPVTVVGSDQSSDIYLFKDPNVLPRHAVIEMRGPRAMLHAAGTVLLDGRPVQTAVLNSGATVQIGRYSFLYRDRERMRA